MLRPVKHQDITVAISVGVHHVYVAHGRIVSIPEMLAA